MIYLKSKACTVRILKSWRPQNFTRFSLSFSSCNFKCIRNVIYRVRQKCLTVFETWRPAYPLGGVSILTISLRNGFWSNCFQQHSFPWKLSGQNIFSRLADIARLARLPEVALPGYFLCPHVLSVLMIENSQLFWGVIKWSISEFFNVLWRRFLRNSLVWRKT